MRLFEDLAEGQVYDCGTRSVSADEVVSFAEQFDPLAMHTDPERAAEGPFGGLIASGIHTFALSQSAAVEGFYADSALVASVGMEELRLPAPLRPDEEMAVEIEVLGCRPSEGDPSRGVVTTRRTATVGVDGASESERGDGPAETGKTVLDITNHTVWRRRG